MASSALSVGSSPPRDHAARLSDPKRLAALALTGLMDDEPDAAFDRFTRLASELLGAPVALVSLVDDHRQFFKSAAGFSASARRETPLSHSFCQYAVSTGQPLIVEDARQHPWLKNNPAVTELSAIAYAGIPLETREHHVLGALCVVDAQPRAWSERELRLLRDLAAMAMTEIEVRGRLAHFHALRAERGQERMLLHAVLSAIQDPITVVDSRGELILANPAARQGSLNAAWLELDGATSVAPQQLPAARALSGEPAHADLVLQVPGQAPRYLSLQASPLMDAIGEVYASVSVGRDVTSTHEAARALAQSEAILKGVLHHLPNGAVLMFDHDLRYAMAGGEKLLSSIGLSPEALVGKTLLDVTTPMLRLLIEPHYRAALRGETSAFEMVRWDRVFAVTTVPLRSAEGAVTAGLAMIYDVTDHKRAEAQVRQEAAENRSRALKDELTGLYNRRGFLERAGRLLEAARDLRRTALLFFVDLNGMKLINDHLGHEQGDRALVEMADVLHICFRDSDVVARLGGDEFVALLPSSDPAQLPALTERIEREIATRNAKPRRAFGLSASIGVAVFEPDSTETLEELLARADAQMYEQKRVAHSRR